MNKAILMGRLGKDIELRYTQSGTAVASFSIAVDRPKDKDGNRITDWIDLVLWGKTAETAEKYLSKGRKIIVEGRIQPRHWEDKNGNKRITTEVVVERWEFADSQQQSAERQRYGESYPETGQYAEQDDDGDLPF